MWETVETKARKSEMAEVEGRRGQRGSKKEMRGKGREKNRYQRC